MAEKINIIDTTLREGEQTPGLLFTLEQKKKIVDGLVAIGVDEIELGIASPLSSFPIALINYCRSISPDLSVSLWSRCTSEDIYHAATLSPNILALSVPVSDLHLEKKLHKSRKWARDSMCTAIGLCHRLGMTPAIGFEDATRADFDFMSMLAREAEDAGALRIRLADTVGTATPMQMAELVSGLKEQVSTCQIGVHTHNDFGMATANAITALEAGAVWVDGVILGLGERSGCARLEEIVGYLALVRGESSLDCAPLRHLADYVAAISGRTIGGQHPVLGDDIFTCETGLHLQGLLNDPQTYEPYDPGRVGRKRHLLFGAKSGTKAILLELSRSRGVEGYNRVLDGQIAEFRNQARLSHYCFSAHEMADYIIDGQDRRV